MRKKMYNNMKKLRLWLSNYQLKHHNCRKHAELIDSYTSQSDCGSWTTNSYKCKVCGNHWDID